MRGGGSSFRREQCPQLVEYQNCVVRHGGQEGAQRQVHAFGGEERFGGEGGYGGGLEMEQGARDLFC